MLKNYIKIAWRNLSRHSFYTILNVFGLALGISCGIILFQFISYHLSFDRYHQKSGNLYRVVTDLNLEDGSVQYEKGAPLALASAIHNAVPQIKDQAFLFQNFRDQSFTVAIPQSGGSPEKLFSEHRNIAFADRNWFTLFDYEWTSGDPNTALEEPNTAVLTQKQAEKYFGNENPVGKTIRLNGNVEVKITGLLKDHPDNTDFKAEVYLSLLSLKSFYPDDFQPMRTEWGWINSSNYLFLELPDGFTPKAAHDAISALKNEHMGSIAKYYDFHLQPLKEIHFDARYGGVISKSLITTLAFVGLIILIIACVNFINMATAQNARRSKEISTRKILGSTTNGIFWQFITETACITLLAIAFSLGLVFLALPVLNHWLQTDLELHPFRDKQLMLALLSLIIFVVVTAGIYPSFMLSRFNPVESLKSRSGTAKQPWLRKGLILFQNLVAQSLIICTLIIMLQSNYVKNADLGFNKEAVVVITIPKPDKNNLTYLRNELLKRPDIKDASFCFRPPSSEIFKAGSVRIDNRDWEKGIALCVLGDSHYLQTFGLQLIAGRNFIESDTAREYLVSEDMVKKLGFPNNDRILGHQLVAGALQDHPGTIVGVVKDFHIKSLRSEIEPILIATVLDDYANAGIKITGVNPSGTIEEIKKIWQSVYPNNIFEYHFLDDQIAEFYQKEDLLNKLIGSFAILAIVISCVGLLGLISLTTIQRTKEIGIRKVIGASVASITILLSKDFAKLVFLALLLATALAWFIMNKWLQGFAYRISIPWWIFFLAGIANLVLAFITISFHAVKAATANPTESLRSE